MENNKYIKNIYEKIILFIDNNNFEPKEYLVDLLGKFINKTQQYYKPYINITFYKLLNYIETDNTCLKQKIIDVIGIIISIFPYEFRSINESLINFLSLLSKDKDEYIKNKSSQILYELKMINNFKTQSATTLYDMKYSTLSSFRKNSAIFNKSMRNSWFQNKKTDSTFSKSTRCTPSRKNIKVKNLSSNNCNYICICQSDALIHYHNNYKNNKNNCSCKAKTLNLNHYRNHYKLMKEKKNNNNFNYNPNSIDDNQNSLLFNLNKLKKDLNNMSSVINNHVNQMENKDNFNI
jgi:hypothetical protein